MEELPIALLFVFELLGFLAFYAIFDALDLFI